MRFFKYTGLGNDFVVVRAEDVPAQLDAVALCDRRFGIGADGVVIVRPLGGNAYEMRILNSDGSVAMMCGNASRCVAKFIRDRLGGAGNAFDLHTLSGVVRTEIRADGLVRVDMGKARDFLGGISLRTDGREFSAETVSMGNPHAVIFTDDVGAVPLEKWGAALEHDAQFPDRCNIEFAQALSREKIRMRVWERGCGVTAACGTGSCATFVAAQKRGLVGAGAEIVLDGGSLFIERESADAAVFMTGAAREVFLGEI